MGTDQSIQSTLCCNGTDSNPNETTKRTRNTDINVVDDQKQHLEPYAFPTPQDIITFWFGKIDSFSAEISGERKENWFRGGTEFDQLILDKYGEFMPHILNTESAIYKQWTCSTQGCLAYVLVADQFTRNVHRNDAKAFAYDEGAQTLVRECIKTGKDIELFELHPMFALFFYMPLLHSENLSDHELRTTRHTLLVAKLDESHNSYGFFNSIKGIGHKEEIQRFGRHPKRNQVLGRESTKEELEWLENQK